MADVCLHEMLTEASFTFHAEVSGFIWDLMETF